VERTPYVFRFANKSYCADESISEKPTDKKKKTEKGDSTLLSPATISKRMKLKFTKAWISFLRLPLPIDVYKEVLASIHLTVIPHLSNPTMLWWANLPKLLSFLYM
jgi:U3 small nucleolar RNA-associated protein 19